MCTNEKEKSHAERRQTHKVTSVRYEHVADLYHEGRSPLARPEDWGQLIDLPRTRRLRVLDLGAGTGIFTRAWPGWGASFVVGLDPSLAMLAQALRAGLPVEARLVAGHTQHLPFAPRTFDAAWLSAVIHHITDRTACARELAHVLMPGGRIYVRGFFAGSSMVGWLPSFPGAERAIARFPSVEDVAEVFGHAGFSLIKVDEVREPARPAEEIRAWIEMMRHADTLLTAFTDAEVAAGLAALATLGATELDGSLHLVTLAGPS
jgi:SAM-dependent methyltransferase